MILGFADLPQYLTKNMAEESQKALNLISDNYGLAKDIAMGRENAPKGMMPESVFIAVENKALAEGDAKTLRELASQSELIAEATSMGQRIRMLGERDPYSAIKKMTDVIRERKKAVEKRLKGKSANKAKEEIKQDLKKRLDKAKPTVRSWASLIDQITC